MGAGGRKMLKIIFSRNFLLQRQNLQNQATSELYTDDNKSKYSCNSEDIFKYSEKIYEKLYTKKTTSKAATTKFFSKISNRRKIYNEQFKLCEAELSLGEIMKTITNYN